MRPFCDCHFLYLRFLTFSSRGPKNAFCLKVAQNIFKSKFNLKAIADIVFDLRNEFHVNRLKFGILGTKMFSTSILAYFDTPRTKYRKFWPLIVLISWKIGDQPIFVWGIRKNWSRDDLSTPRFQVLRVLLTFSIILFNDIKKIELHEF